MTPKCPYCSGEMRPGVLRTAQSAGVCFEPTPGLSDTVDLAGPYVFRRDIPASGVRLPQVPGHCPAL